MHLLFLIWLLAGVTLALAFGPTRQLVLRRPPPDDACEVGPTEHAAGRSMAERLRLGRFRRAPTLAERGYAGAVRRARARAHDAHALPPSLAAGTAVAHAGPEMADEIAPAASGHAPDPIPHGVTPANDRPEQGAGPGARQVPPPERPESRPTAGGAQAFEQHPPRP